MANAQLNYLINPAFQFVNKAGKPLANGYIELYIHGSRTKYYAASDFDGNLHPFKIRLDSIGSQIVLVSPLNHYDMYVYDEIGSLILSRYDVGCYSDGTVTGEVTITSNDDSVAIAASPTDTGMAYDLSVGEFATKEYVDEAIANEEAAREAADNNLQAAIDDISDALADKKDKQLSVNYVGNNRRTITDLRQDENGKITFVTFSDIDFPGEVPNIEIESNTLSVESTIDEDTHTKTFTIELEGSDLDYYNAGKNNGTSVSMNNKAMWLPLANQSNVYGSNRITMNTDYTRANLDANKKYLCCAEVYWNVNKYNIADTVATLSLNYQIGQNTANPFMVIEVDMSRETDGYRYVTWLTEGADWTGIYASLSNNAGKSVRVAISHFIAIEQTAIAGSAGSAATYTAGDAIDITNDTISVKYGNGLELDATDNKLQVKLGKGLKFDTAAGIEGEISIDDIGQEVIDEVLKLESELDKKITTTFNYAQITSAEDFAPFGISNTTRMIGQLFAVPISSEIRKNDTLICIRAKQSYAGKVSFGIFEFDFDGNDGSGSTTWLCDTGVVSVKEGENQFPLKYIMPTSTVRPTIKMEPGKLYYATVMIANDAPATGLFLASCQPYDQNYNATPKYTMVVSNMDSHVDWSIGTQRNAWFEGYNEFNNVPRLFMMIRNGEATPVPTIDPFANYESFTLAHQYHINDLFSLTLNASNQPVLYQKIRPAQDCTITKIGWVDYHNNATYEHATDIPLLIDSNYTSMTTFGQNVETSSGTKIDGEHYYHEFSLSTPINLQADTNYFVPCNMKISGADSEWIITYNSPSGTSKDLILFDSKHNVASWAGNHAEYRSSQPGTFCRIFTDDGKSYTF